MIESWPQRGGVIGDGYLFWHPSFFFFFVFSSCSLWSTQKEKPSTDTHIHGPLLYIYRHSGTLYTRHNEAEAKRRRGDILLLVLLLHRLFSAFLKKIFPTHTRPPGRQVDICWGPMSWGFFFDRVLLVGAVPSSESSFSFFPHFLIHNVMIQLCVSSIDSAGCLQCLIIDGTL